MSKVFKQLTNRESIGLCSMDSSTLIHHPQRPSTYEISGVVYNASCVGCLNPRCIRFSADELKLSDSRLDEFPVDADDTVCPMNAIVWGRGDRTPSILSDRCINCGVCARRCPFGAIYFNGYTATVHDGEAEVSFVATTQDNLEQHLAQNYAALKNRHIGQYATPNISSVEAIYEKLHEMQTEAQFPNLIIRNLLLILGNKCIIRRRGDVYFRIDAIITDNPSVGIAEIEFHKDSLESPRAILDDIAVLSSRYGINKEEIRPFIVSLEFPNIRTEYWRVIKDIKDVLGIRIHSLTLGALCLMAWSFNEIPIGTVDFYADIDAPSIQAEIERLCGFGELSKTNGYAVLEPIK